MGLQRATQHQAAQRTSVPGADSPGLQPVSGVIGGSAHEVDAAAQARSQGSAVCRRGGQSRLHDQHALFERPGCRPRCEWGIAPQLTADLTANPDFAQVEADDEQFNLTRFPGFFPEKRQFFLENASVFQCGNPQHIDYFFSRRIGLSPGGVPIDILGGGRVSGKAGAWNVGVMDIQTDDEIDPRTRRLIAPANNFGVARVQREIGRSNVGAVFVNRQATSDAGSGTDCNRVYGVDAALQLSANDKWFGFAGRSDTEGAKGTGYSSRAFYSYANPTWSGHVGHVYVGDRFNAEVGFVPRVGIHRSEVRLGYQGLALAAMTNRYAATQATHWFSPAVLTQDLLSAVAATDVPAHAAFQRAVRTFQHDNATRLRTLAFRATPLSSSDFPLYPAYAPEARPALWRQATVARGVMTLAGTIMGLGIAGLWRLSRALRPR